MAVYECDYGRHRYPQAQQSIYFTHIIGSAMDNYSMRLCPKHFREVWVGCQETMSEIDEDSQSSVSCERCGADKAGCLYAKVFPAKEPERQYVVDLCAEDLSALGNTLRIFNGRALSSR